MKIENRRNRLQAVAMEFYQTNAGRRNHPPDRCDRRDGRQTDRTSQ